MRTQWDPVGTGSARQVSWCQARFEGAPSHQKWTSLPVSHMIFFNPVTPAGKKVHCTCRWRWSGMSWHSLQMTWRPFSLWLPHVWMTVTGPPYGWWQYWTSLAPWMARRSAWWNRPWFSCCDTCLTKMPWVWWNMARMSKWWRRWRFATKMDEHDFSMQSKGFKSAGNSIDRTSNSKVSGEEISFIFIHPFMHCFSQEIYCPHLFLLTKPHRPRQTNLSGGLIKGLELHKDNPRHVAAEAPKQPVKAEKKAPDDDQVIRVLGRSR